MEAPCLERPVDQPAMHFSGVIPPLHEQLLDRQVLTVPVAGAWQQCEAENDDHREQMHGSRVDSAS